MGSLFSALRRFAGPAGRPLNRYAALLLAVWLTHAVLRIAFLFRNDGFGFPIVGKPDWYIFHAFCIDLLWINLWSLPFFLGMLLIGRRGTRTTHYITYGLLFLLAFLHAFLLVFTVIDHETLRFMGMHFDPGTARTYGNTAAVRQVFHFLASDASIKGLPYVLFFGCVPLAALLFEGLRRRAWARATTWRLRPVAWILFGCLVSFLYVYVIWTGGNRMRLLRPVADTFAQSLWNGEAKDEPADSLSRLTRAYQAHWLRTSGDTDWVFPDSAYPYYREPLETACARAAAAGHGDTTKLAAACRVDADGDGHPKWKDCLDADARAHPGAVDVPGDGIDQDCDGRDAEPWNFVLFFLESHRALNVGHLGPYGAPYSATPFLDSLATNGHYWTRMIASGVPTINALVSIHMSIPQHPTRYISSEFTGLRHEAFTSILARHGYTTHYFSAADPAWDNQTPWLRQWYQGFSYSRDRENDAATFAHMGAWLRDSLPRGRPYCVSVMTKTNHYPFNAEPGVKPLPDSASLVSRMNATMSYTDAGMRTLVDSLRRLPAFRRTIFIVVADHGFPLSEHGSSQIGYGLYTESVWLPFVISGAHPRLGAVGPRHDLASEIDIGPTVLDLAGIREPNAFVGHSLLSPAPRDRQSAFLLRGEQAIVEHGPYRWHGAWGAQPREQGEQLFDIEADRLEKHDRMHDSTEPLSASETRLRDSAEAFARDFARLHLHVVEKNALLPEIGPESAGSSQAR